MKKFFTAFLIIIAIIAAIASGGYYAYKYGERETLEQDRQRFYERIESFAAENGVECFDEHFSFKERIAGWYFFRFDGSLYISCEYLGFEGVEKVLYADVINLGGWFENLNGGESMQCMSEDKSCTVSYLASDGSEAAKLLIRVGETGVSVTNLFTDETYTADNDFDDYIPPVKLAVISPEVPLDVMRESLVYRLLGTPYTGGEVTLSYAGSSIRVDEYAEWLGDSYIVPAEDGFYVLCTLCYASDWYETALVHWTEDEGLKLIDCYTGGVLTPDWINTEENTVKLESRISVFGTYFYYRTYKIGENGLQPLSDIYDFENEPKPGYWAEINAAGYPEESLENIRQMMDSRGRRKLTLKKDTVCFTAGGRENTIRAGSEIAPTGIDPEMQRFYFEWYGVNYYFEYAIDEDTWTYSTGGISEKQLFEAVFYAG